MLTKQKKFGILETQLEKETKCSLKTKQNVNFELSGLIQIIIIIFIESLILAQDERWRHA